MNKYVKAFFHRGLVFGGFGPIVAGIVYLILSFAIPNFTLAGIDVFTAIVSTYLLAFVHAGVSVFNQIESWPIAKSLLCHLSALYVAYVSCYVLNSWIPFDPIVLVIFTAIFIATYFVIWSIVMICIKATGTALNRQLL